LGRPERLGGDAAGPPFPGLLDGLVDEVLAGPWPDAALVAHHGACVAQALARRFWRYGAEPGLAGPVGATWASDHGLSVSTVHWW
jgi:hypothetical protein